VSSRKVDKAVGNMLISVEAEIRDRQARHNQPAKPRSDDPIDHVHLERYTLGNRQAECEILHLFVEHLPQFMAQLRDAAHDRNAQAWFEAAHSLKGAALSVGASPISEIAHEAEQAAKVCWLFDLSKLIKVIDVTVKYIGQHYCDDVTGNERQRVQHSHHKPQVRSQNFKQTP